MNRRWLFACWLVPALGIVLAGGPAGAQDTPSDLIIVVSSPGEGETFYTSGTFRLSMPISGQVFSYGVPLHPETVEVSLELVEASGDRAVLTVPLDDRGHFNAHASMLSRTNPWPSDDPHAEMVCGECHRTDVELALPEDVTHLVISARAADGRSAQVTRSLRFDYGTLHNLNVKVEGLTGGSVGAQVSATTLIYQWRRRTFFSSIVDGQATLAVEGLTHADLTYEVSLPPFIQDGTLYTAPAQTVVVRAGQEAMPVTLSVQPTRGSLTGQVVAGLSDTGVNAAVLAVNLQTGAGLATQTGDDGRFTFDNVPMAEHALLARAPDGFHLPQCFDLAESSAVETTVHLTPAGTAVLRGRVLLDGQPLPFAQATTAGLPTAHADPLTGAFELDAVNAAGALEADITAEGAYSLAVTSADRDLGDINLVLRTDTQVIDRGGWRLYIPAASRLREINGVYTLENGVFWVTGAGADTALFSVEGFNLQGRDAHFSVEDMAGAMPRLFVSQGDVLVTRDGWDEPLTVSTGQTLMLQGEQVYPADLVPGAGALLRQVAGSVARFELAPSAAEQQSAAVSGLVTVVAQIFMLLAVLITYLIMPVVIVGGGAYYLYRRRRV